MGNRVMRGAVIATVAFTAAAVVQVATAALASANPVTTQLGNTAASGTTLATTTCPSGTWAVGIVVHNHTDTDYVRGVQLLCSDGTTTAFAGGVSTPGETTGDSSCATGDRVVGVGGRSGLVVDAVGAQCATTVTGTPYAVAAVGSSGGSAMGPAYCPSGYDVVGLKVWWGDYLGEDSVKSIQGVCAAVTTTTLTTSPAHPGVGHAYTATATISRSAANGAITGTVAFYLNGVFVVSEPVSGTTASFNGTVPHLPATLVAVYSGSAHYAASTSNTILLGASSCTTTITGDATNVSATSGLLCVFDAQVTGGISVNRGVTLDVLDSTLSGGIAASAPAAVQVCNSTTGSINVSKASGFVRIGDPTSSCAGNTVNGSVLTTANRGSGIIADNIITGTITTTANVPAFTVTGNVS